MWDGNERKWKMKIEIDYSPKIFCNIVCYQNSTRFARPPNLNFPNRYLLSWVKFMIFILPTTFILKIFICPPLAVVICVGRTVTPSIQVCVDT